MRIDRPLLASCLLAAASLGPAAAAQQAHVVDWANGPGTDFVTIQAAVNAAAAGDTVLVRVGIYGGVTLQGKGVSIVADTGSETLRPIVGAVRIENVPAGQHALFRGFQSSITPNPFGATSNLVLSGNAGHVLVENVELDGGAPVVSVAGTSQALFTRCAMTGTGAALQATGGAVHVHECTLEGGQGKDGAVTPFGTIPAGDGHPGLRVDGGMAVVSGSTLVGGQGGTGDTQCNAPGDGGPGLHLTGAAPTAWDVGSSFSGGPGGVANASCPPSSGASGPPIDAPAGALVTIPESHRSLRLSSPVREGKTLGFDLKGVAGEPTLLLFSFQEGVQAFPALSGTLVPGAPLFGVSFLVIPPGGTVSFATALPQNLLPAGIEALEAFVQIAVPGALGQGVIGGSSVLTLVDDSV